MNATEIELREEYADAIGREEIADYVAALFRLNPTVCEPDSNLAGRVLKRSRGNSAPDSSRSVWAAPERPSAEVYADLVRLWEAR